MIITPRGMSVQEAYRHYVDGKFLVNRRYQRKLVWSVNEKEYLIDSILKGLPIPLILLGESSENKLEIIDGLQRMNAIISFIENRFSLNGKYFDVRQFTRAQQAGDGGTFDYKKEPESLLSPEECANILDYQLATTTYPTTTEDEITNIFGRINSGGKQLSPQEKRQAGMTDNFSNLVKKISSEIRGDSSEDSIPLSEMPQISIDSTRENIGYGLKADDIFWCAHGILRKNQLRDSEDEEMIADIVASTLHEKPIARSKELFDKMYDSDDDENKNLNSKLSAYGQDRIIYEIKATFSILKEIFKDCTIKDAVAPKSNNPIKGSFFALFMAIFHLTVKEEQSPNESASITQSIKSLQSKMISTANYSTTSDRQHNVNLTIGLIQPYFIKKDPPAIHQGASLIIDLENSMRRSKIETNRYECKQGFVNLSDRRDLNEELYTTIINTICGIANVGPASDGFIFLGVADKKNDADKIKSLDSINPIEINERFIVGINREIAYAGCKSIDEYIHKITQKITLSNLTDPLKTQVLSQIDVIDYRGLTVVRIRIPKQKTISYVGNKSFVRENSDTIELTGPKLVSISQLFN